MSLRADVDSMMTDGPSRVERKLKEDTAPAHNGTYGRSLSSGLTAHIAGYALAECSAEEGCHSPSGYVSGIEAVDVYLED
jgi:hypothetical protein